jgi:hypothetical protein
MKKRKQKIAEKCRGQNGAVTEKARQTRYL